MPLVDFFVRRLYFPKSIPRSTPWALIGMGITVNAERRCNAMNDEKYVDYDKMEQLERLFGSNPFEDWTEEEIEELLKQLHDYFEDDYQWSGRF